MTETDTDRLARYGYELYGPSWQTPLAVDLGVTLRTLQRWAAGRRPIQANVWGELAALLRAKSPRCLALADEAQRLAA